MEGKNQPIIVVVESGVDIGFYVGRGVIDLRPVVRNLYRLAFFVLCLIGNLSGLGFPGPRAGEIHFQCGEL